MSEPLHKKQRLDSVKDDLKDDLLCTICCEGFALPEHNKLKVPRSLMCGHQYCSACIKALPKIKNNTCLGQSSLPPFPVCSNV